MFAVHIMIFNALLTHHLLATRRPRSFQYWQPRVTPTVTVHARDATVRPISLSHSLLCRIRTTDTILIQLHKQAERLRLSVACSPAWPGEHSNLNQGGCFEWRPVV
jgi:hypothetical protein